jgi:hypothetical protein
MVQNSRAERDERSTASNTGDNRDSLTSPHAPLITSLLVGISINSTRGDPRFFQSDFAIKCRNSFFNPRVPVTD